MKTILKYLAAAALVSTAAAQTTSVIAAFFNFGYHFKQYNRGLMTALMPNLDATSDDTTCVISADATSDVMFEILDWTNFPNGSFNVGIFMNTFNILMILMMQQFEDCGIAELMIQYDSTFSHWADLTSMGVNLAVMLGTGYADKDTAPFKTWDLWKEGWARKDWKEIGVGLMLLMAQLTKYEATPFKQDVIPMSFF